MKIKKHEDIKIQRNNLQDEIKRDFKIQTSIIVILVILATIICFKSLKLAIDYEVLKKEKQTLEEVIETQSSMIADLEENLRELFILIEDSKEGVLHGRNLEGY